MSAVIYIEGGGRSKELRTRCREGFRKLLEKCGLSGRMPRLIACGSRNDAFGDFKTSMDRNSGVGFIAMLIDSEEPLTDIEATWNHLAQRDNWQRPPNAQDQQVLFMTTCMETWIIADRAVLSEHFGQELHDTALPALSGLEDRARDAVQDALKHATRDCLNKYAKGKRSFEVLAKVSSSELKKHLPSFSRFLTILTEKC